MRCGGIATRLVSDFKEDCPADAGAGPNTGASVGGATSSPSSSIRISSSSAVGGFAVLSPTTRDFFFFDNERRFLRWGLEVLGVDCTTTIDVNEVEGDQDT